MDSSYSSQNYKINKNVNDKMRLVNSGYLSPFRNNPIYINSKVDATFLFANIPFRHKSFAELMKFFFNSKQFETIVIVCDLNTWFDVIKFIVLFFARMFTNINFFVLILNKSIVINNLLRFNEKILNKYCRNKIVFLHEYASEFGELQFYNVLKFKKKLTDFEIEAFIPHKNELDSLVHVVNHLLKKGIKVHIVDDFSDLTTKNEMSIAFKNDPNIKITYLDKTVYYDWTGILRKIDELSQISSADFILRCDSDEYLYSNIQNMDLKEFLLLVFSTDFDFVDATVVNLYSENMRYKSVEDATHLSFSQEPSYEKVLRAWRNNRRIIGLEKHAGHFIEKQESSYFPMRLTLLHAGLRNFSQASQKIVNRNRDGAIEFQSKGWHSHYLNKTVEELMKIPVVNFPNNSNFWKINGEKRQYKIGLDFYNK